MPDGNWCPLDVLHSVGVREISDMAWKQNAHASTLSCLSMEVTFVSE